MSITRRRFVAGSVTTAAALSVMPTKVRGANDQVRIGVVGMRGRGKTHVDYAADCRESHNAQVVALCDVDAGVLNNRIKWAEDNYKYKCDGHENFREMLDRKDIDVISIATPNHLHALMAIEAMQAGKDVYVEKPVSHNVWEGRQIVNAARKYKKICQTGTQSRSMHGMHKMIDYIHGGELGKVKYVVGTCYKARRSIGKRSEPMDIPGDVNYDLWCGPAAKVDLYRNSLHYDWHWDFNTGNGDLGNQGIHQMDLARWFTGHQALSPRVMSVGGRLGYDDAGNTANTQVIFHDYPDAPIIFEVRGLPNNREKFEKGKWGNGDMDRGPRNVGSIGVLVVCEGGHLAVNSYHSGSAYDSGGKRIKSFSGGGNHMGNFLDSVRSRNHETLNADILEGHLSSALCHTGNISYLLGHTEPGEKIASQIKSDIYADSYARMTDHLHHLGIKTQGNALTAGPWLDMNPSSERFPGNETANKLLSRDYRKGYVVPDLS